MIKGRFFAAVLYLIAVGKLGGKYIKGGMSKGHLHAIKC
jgi:hypothetical protein